MVKRKAAHSPSAAPRGRGSAPRFAPLTLRTSVAGSQFPAVPNAEGARLLGLLWQLEESQWWPAEEVREGQRLQLEGLLRHAWETVPWYRRAWQAVGFDPERPLTWEAFATLPLLERDTLRAEAGDLASRRMPAEHGRLREARSSGSTGQPVRVITTDTTHLFWMAFTLRDHLWHRRDFGGHLASIRSIAHSDEAGQDFASWGPPVDLLFHSGTASLLNVRTPVARQAEWLAVRNPAYLLSLPSNLEALANHCRRQGIALPNLREVRSIGENLRPEVRQTIQQAWGAPLRDVYSAQELGYLAIQCPSGHHYHIQSEGVVLEVLDQAGRPCPPGQAGRVVVTALHNFAMPLVRYAVGDWALVGEPCRCGRGLPVLERVLGRGRNMLALPEGGSLWPTFPSKVWDRLAPIRQLQMIQHTYTELEVRLWMDRAPTPPEELALSEALQQRLGRPFRFTFTWQPTPLQQANGKFEDFICRVTVSDEGGG